MTAFTAVTDGDWDDPATWDVGSGYPSSSADTATIGAYTVTIPDGVSITCGVITTTGSTPTWAILIITGSLTLTANAALYRLTEIRLSPGGVLDINGNVLDVKEDVSYGWYYFNFVGTPSNRGAFQDTIGGGRFVNVTFGETKCQVEFQYCDFSGFADIKLGNQPTGTDHCHVQDCVFVDYTGAVDFGGSRQANTDIIVRRNDFRGTTTSTLTLQNTPASLGTGVADFTANTYKPISGTPQINLITNTTEDFDASGSVFDDVNLVRLGPGTVNQTGCFIHSSATGGSMGSSVTNAEIISASYVIMTGDNPHTINGICATLSDGVIEATYDSFSDDGDHYIVSNNPCVVTGNLILDTKNGVLMNSLGSAATSTYSCDHNTCVVSVGGAYGILARNESGGTFAGTLNTRSNIIHDRSATAGTYGFNFDGVTNDQVSNMDYNNWSGIELPYQGVISATKTAGVTVGFGGLDTTLDPQFFDDTRTLATWDLNVGTGAGTVAAAVTEMLTLNGYNSTSKTQVVAEKTTHSIASVVSWVRDGYAPQNISLKDAGHDSVTVGAIEYISAISGNINDEILRATGGPTVNEGLSTWFSRTASESLGDAARRWLLAKASTTSGSNRDLWYEFLRDEGYSGAVNDMLLSYWRDQP